MTTDIFIVIGLLLLALAIFFSPTIIAFSKKHDYRWIILFINIVFGFTLIGWFGALIWAIAGDDII
jgi:hypothetical protein